MNGIFVVGVPTYDRPRILKTALQSLVNLKLLRGVIVVADASCKRLYEEYKNMLDEIHSEISSLVYDLHLGRRGSTNARNRIFDLALEHFSEAEVIVMFEDDCICSSKEWLLPLEKWINHHDIGLVGGRRINLRRQRVDPEIYIDFMPYLADTLTHLTGFIFLNAKYGPRYTQYTTHSMAIKMEVIKKGIRYDPNYGGTGYREESDFQDQVRKSGYRIVHDPSFYVYHLGFETGGDRGYETLTRFYWKSRNNIYFMKKHGKPIYKLIISTAIILIYTLPQGLRVVKATIRGLKEGLQIPLKRARARKPTKRNTA